MATSANQQQAGIYLPAKQTIGNQAIKPVQNDPVKLPQQNIDPVTGRPVDQAGSGMTATSKPTATTGVGDKAPSMTTTSNGASSSTGGLLGAISVTQPQKPASPEFNYQSTEYKNVAGNAPTPTMNTPQTSFTANQYQSDGFTGVKGNTEFNYDPRSESLVQNQLTGLLDPNNPLMKRAVSQSQELAASRGLQSSSIAAGAGTGAMIDRALPIAQQDAQTYGNAQQLGWQQGFQADQNNLAREQDARMFDKQGGLQTQLQNNQFSFENTQQNASRAMQAELQQLQYKQSLGLLDAQGAQRMQELNAQQGFQAAMQDLQYKQQMGVLDYQGQQQLQQMERSAQLNQQRDVLMQRFNDMNMDKSFLQNLQLTQMQYQQQDSMFEKQVSAQAAMDYRNAVSTGYNYYLEQVAAVYGNPNMTPEQQAAGVAKLGQLFEQQRLQLQAIYGFAAPAQPALPGTGGNPTNPIPGDWNGLPPGNGATPIPSPGSNTTPGSPQPIQPIIPGAPSTQPQLPGGGLLDMIQPIEYFRAIQ